MSTLLSGELESALNRLRQARRLILSLPELFVAIGHSELPGRAWMIVSGVLSIIAGVIVALVPLPSLFVLTLILGFWLIIFGGMLIGRAFHARSDANRLRSASLRPSGA